MNIRTAQPCHASQLPVGLLGVGSLICKLNAPFVHESGMLREIVMRAPIQSDLDELLPEIEAIAMADGSNTQSRVAAIWLLRLTDLPEKLLRALPASELPTLILALRAQLARLDRAMQLASKSHPNI